MVFPTKNIEHIARILNHPKVYKWLSDDCSPSVFVPVISDSVIYLMDETNNGVVRLDPENGICCQAHIALTPELWGKGAEFTKECMLWGVENTRYMKVITMIPSYNKLTVSMVKKCGFVQEGLLKKSFLKDWKLYDQFIYSITKRQILEGELCHQ